jgi:DNA anti-recombination protein RmuC
MADPKTKMEVMYNHVLEEVGDLIDRIELVKVDLSSVDGRLKKAIDEYAKLAVGEVTAGVTADAMRQLSKTAAETLLHIRKARSLNDEIEPQEEFSLRGAIVTTFAAILLICLGVGIGFIAHPYLARFLG